MIRSINPSVPIIVVTGDTRPETIIDLFRKGITQYVMKPIVPEVLKKALLSSLDRNVDFLLLCRQLHIFNSFSTAIFLIDGEKRIIYANNAFRSLFGFYSEDMETRPMCCDILNFDICKDTPLCTNSQNGCFREVDISCSVKENKYNLNASFIPALGESGETTAYLVALNDLSSEVALQSSYLELYEEEQRKAIELLNVTEKLRALNDNLESEVSQRTDELLTSKTQMKEVLDVIDISILSFDSDGLISEGYTLESLKVFGLEAISGLNILDVLKAQSEEKQNEFKQWIEMAFNVFQRFSWEKIDLLNPFTEWQNLEKTLITHFMPITVDGALRRIMMITKDVTEERELSRKYIEEKQQRTQEVETLTQILNIPEESLFLFFKELNSRNKVLSKLMKSGLTQVNYNLAKRCAHTVKGGAALMQVNEIEKLAHDLEDKIENAIDKDLQDQDLQNELQSSYQRFENCAKRLLNWAAKLKIYTEREEHTRKTKIEHSRINQLVQLLEKVPGSNKGPSQKEIDEELAYWHGVLTVKCNEYFKPMITMVKNLAVSQEKSLKPLVLNGGDLRITPEFAEKWVDPLNHLLRNAVSHGIEFPEERVSYGKSDEGEIQVSFDSSGGMFTIEIKDDGRGIDVNKVIKKCRKLDTAMAKDLSEQEKLNLVFTPGLSTADSISEVSGRGVGLNIVQTMIESNDGTVELDSVKGKGCCFKLSMPKD
ncbi:MAG: Hpt domain-containing protein [Planctomycetes bacterium]|nr:Hpt domain-containing protein [Planctomycetota bacterium]